VKQELSACIFDLDGVIVDTAKYHFEAWRNLGVRLGFPFDEEFNENLKGVSRIESLKLILSHANITLSKKDFERALIDKNDEYLQLISSMDKDEILPGVLPYLINLCKKGIPIALGSASKNARKILNQIELIDFFDFISDGTMVKRSKPDPEVFLLVTEHFGLDPKKCVVFEDSIKGVIAANTAEFVSIGIGDSSVLHMADDVYDSLQGKSPEILSKFINDKA